ncbi:hypothetical protein [uncultured Halomonas sp.]|uniref:hypothetical protein n=1 Tax=uncultured Halomonas sp. TaxID=173971 RepID=UPI0026048030|nr:hypothetical protein [uncultured Halomonas sp.]
MWKWLEGVFSNGSVGGGRHGIEMPMSEVNPANGLPMIGGQDSLDIAGNPWGTDSGHTDVMHDGIFEGHDVVRILRGENVA